MLPQILPCGHGRGIASGYKTGLATHRGFGINVGAAGVVDKRKASTFLLGFGIVNTLDFFRALFR